MLTPLVATHGDALGESILGYPTSWVTTMQELVDLENALQKGRTYE